MMSQGSHAAMPPGSVIAGRYKVVSEIGKGNFACVVKCTDITRPGADPVAVKLIKKEYATDASFEYDMLKAITKGDPTDQHKVLKLLDRFTWHQFPCFVFPLKGVSLRSRRFGVTTGHIDRNTLANFVKQMAQAMKYLHFDLKMVHTDLKPENIVLDDPIAPGSLDGIGSNWSIVDFGSASFYSSKLDSDLISTRPYRALEVCLSQEWCWQADIWSMACIIYEMYTGSKLFDVQSDHDQFIAYERRLGKLPLHITRSSRVFRKFFDMNGRVLNSQMARVSHIRSVDDVLNSDPEFLDLMKRMLEYDPKLRISASDILDHPFVSNATAASSRASSQATQAVSMPRQKSTSPPQSKPLAVPRMQQPFASVQGLVETRTNVIMSSHKTTTTTAAPIKKESMMTSVPKMQSPAYGSAGVTRYSPRYPGTTSAYGMHSAAPAAGAPSYRQPAGFHSAFPSGSQPGGPGSARTSNMDYGARYMTRL